jgi:hypothetical protein
VNFLEGNHQPSSGGPPPGKTTPVAREIRFYAPVAPSAADRDTGPLSHSGLYSAIHGSLRARAHSGDDGKFSVTLRPGKYSVFVEDGSDWYCNGESPDGLCLVTVPDSSPLECALSITYAASF